MSLTEHTLERSTQSRSLEVNAYSEHKIKLIKTLKNKNTLSYIIPYEFPYEHNPNLTPYYLSALNLHTVDHKAIIISIT